MAPTEDTSPAIVQTISDTRRTEMPESRAASGFDAAPRMARPVRVRASSSVRAMAMIGATTIVRIWLDVSTALPISHRPSKGWG